MQQAQAVVTAEAGNGTVVGETVATATGKLVHSRLAAERRASGDFDLVNQPISDAAGNAILVTRCVDLKMCRSEHRAVIA